MNFTNDTEKLMKQLYREFLDKKKASQENPKFFPPPLNIDDISDNIDELEGAGYLIANIDYSFDLQPAFIAFMENRYKNKAWEIVDKSTDIIAKFVNPL